MVSWERWRKGEVVMKTRQKTGFCIISALVVLFWWGQVAAGMDIYGDFFTGLNYVRENEEFLEPSPDGNLGAYLGGNLYFSHKDWQLYQFLLDLRLEGNMADRNVPVNLGINQLFLQVPLSDYSFLYCGKKI